MSYGYIVGEEMFSLHYYERRLKEASNPDERKKLEVVVQNLRRAVEAQRSTSAAPREKEMYSSFEFQGGIGR